MKKIKVGIVGYGNLGKAIEEIVVNKDEFELVAIFSRRKGLKSKFQSHFELTDDLKKYKGIIDIIFLSVGSFSDIEHLSKKVACDFNFVDSFDTHKKLKDYVLTLDEVAKENQKVTLSAFGWDPGLMSMIRVLFDGLSKDGGKAMSFWGKGVSQGHSDAIRRVDGVKNAIQYTIPKDEILRKCKRLYNYNLKDNEKHDRLCFVTTNAGADKKKIENDIKTMQNYFVGYDTKVNFVDEETVETMQKKMSHKGYIVDNYKIVNKFKTRLELKLVLQSNPYFTANIMIVGAKIVDRLLEENKFGAYTILDIPVKYFCDEEREKLLETKL